MIRPEDRFSPHDLKRKGVTDTQGTGAEKKDAAGLSEAMMKTYDKSVPTVKPSAKQSPFPEAAQRCSRNPLKSGGPTRTRTWNQRIMSPLL